jgi:hypothetical protein
MEFCEAHGPKEREAKIRDMLNVPGTKMDTSVLGYAEKWKSISDEQKQALRTALANAINARRALVFLQPLSVD